MEFHGSKTEKNLLTAFTGESHARNKYTFYAKEAKKAGYVQLSDVYTKSQRMKKNTLKFGLNIFTTGDISDTITNLKELILKTKPMNT